jgi:hypothetical protein
MIHHSNNTISNIWPNWTTVSRFSSNNRNQNNIRLPSLGNNKIWAQLWWSVFSEGCSTITCVLGIIVGKNYMLRIQNYWLKHGSDLKNVEWVHFHTDKLAAEAYERVQYRHKKKPEKKATQNPIRTCLSDYNFWCINCGKRSFIKSICLLIFFSDNRLIFIKKEE